MNKSLIISLSVLIFVLVSVIINFIWIHPGEKIILMRALNTCDAVCESRGNRIKVLNKRLAEKQNTRSNE